MRTELELSYTRRLYGIRIGVRSRKGAEIRGKVMQFYGRKGVWV